MKNRTYNIIDIPCLFNLENYKPSISYDIFHVFGEKVFFQAECYSFLPDSKESFLIRLWVMADKINFEEIRNLHSKEAFELNVKYKLALPNLDKIEESIGKVIFILKGSNIFPQIIPLNKSSYLYKCYNEGINLNEMLTLTDPKKNK